MTASSCSPRLAVCMSARIGLTSDTALTSLCIKLFLLLHCTCKLIDTISSPKCLFRLKICFSPSFAQQISKMLGFSKGRHQESKLCLPRKTFLLIVRFYRQFFYFQVLVLREPRFDCHFCRGSLWVQTRNAVRSAERSFCILFFPDWQPCACDP